MLYYSIANIKYFLPVRVECHRSVVHMRLREDLLEVGSLHEGGKLRGREPHHPARSQVQRLLARNFQALEVEATCGKGIVVFD